MIEIPDSPDEPQSSEPPAREETLVGPGEPTTRPETLVGAGNVTLGSEGDGDPGDALDIGTVIAGRYEVLGILGRGGMGCVYRVRDRNAHSLNNWEVHRALKTVAGGVAALDRVKREVAAGELAHQNLVRTTDFGFIDQNRRRFYIVMDLIGGGTLLDVIAANPGTIPTDRARRLIEGILQGLQALHQRGVVHRDLKPSNVLIDTNQDERPCLADFGIAQDSGHQHTSLRGSGSAHYSAPEQASGTVTPASDIYAFGMVAFQLLVGRLPRYGDPPLHLLRADVPRAACKLFMDCMQTSPAKRPSSATETLERLHRDWPRHAQVDSPTSHTEAAMERLIASGHLEQALENAAIARETAATSARIAWLAAKALQALNRLRDAYHGYREALALGPEPRGQFAFDFATLLRQIGRLEEAAQELGGAIEDETDSEIRHFYLQLLHDCRRTSEAALWAAERLVVPRVPEVARESALAGLERGQNDYVVACAAAADPSEEDCGDLAAAAGLAYLALGDATAALPRLVRAREAARFGTDAKIALWDTLNRVGRHAEAVDLLPSIERIDEELVCRHLEGCLQKFVSLNDGFRIAAVLQRSERLPDAPDLLATAACVLDRCCLPVPELRLLTRTLTNLGWANISSAAGPEGALTVEFRPDFNRATLPRSTWPVADVLFSQLMKRVRERTMAHETIGRLAHELIDRGFDSHWLREIRFDYAPDFETLPVDAAFLRRSGMFTDERRNRLLEAAEACQTTDRKLGAIRQCLEFDPHWLEPSHALLQELGRSAPRDLEPIELAVIAQHASQPSHPRPDAMTNLALDVLAGWMIENSRRDWHCKLREALETLAERQREIPTEEVGSASLKPFDVVQLARNCLDQSVVPSRSSVSRQIALSPKAAEALAIAPKDQIELLRLVASDPESDLDGDATRLLVIKHALEQTLQTLMPWLRRRIAAGGTGGMIAATTTAVLALRGESFEDAARWADAGDSRGEFRLANLLARGTALRGLRRLGEAIADFDAAEACLQDDSAVQIAELLDMKPAAMIALERADARRLAGQFEEAAADMHRVPKDYRDARWACETAQHLFNVRAPGRHAIALNFCREQMRDSLRSMQLVLLRFERDVPDSHSASKLRDAAALAADRFPWLRPYGAPDMPPIKEVAPDGDRLADASEQADSEEPEAVVKAAWASIARVLVPFVLTNSSSTSQARARLLQLKSITLPEAWEAATTTVEAAAALEDALKERHAAPAAPTASDLVSLDKLSKEPLLLGSLRAHAIWIVRRASSRTWRQKAFASHAPRLLEILATTGAERELPPASLALLEAVSNRPEQARWRLADAVERNALEEDEARTFLIGQGMLPDDSAWRFRDRVSFVRRSRHPLARCFRWALSASILLTMVSFILRSRLHPGMACLGTLLLLVSTLTWPAERGADPGSAWHLVMEEQQPQAAIALVLAVLAVTIIAVSFGRILGAI